MKLLFSLLQVATWTWIVFALCFTAVAQEQLTANREADKPLSVEEVRSLLSRLPRDYPPSEAEMERLNQIIARGPRLIPAFKAILTESADSYEISRVLSISKKIEGDKSPLLPAIRQLLKRDDKWIRISAVWALRDIGGPVESATLLQCLEDEDQGVRKVSAESLGKIGDAETASEMESILSKRKATMTLEQMTKDTSVAALEKAISDIREKVGKKESEAKPAAKKEPQPEEGRNWLLPGLIVIGVVIAGVILFVLLRRR
jgi:hypothetical protein